MYTLKSQFLFILENAIKSEGITVRGSFIVHMNYLNGNKKAGIYCDACLFMLSIVFQLDEALVVKLLHDLYRV